MKRIVFVIAIVTFFISACNQKHAGTAGENRSTVTENTARADTGHARIQFKAYQHDFGNMVEGEIVSYIFTFTNTGTAPLLISSASASCGCTVPKYSKKPVQPGDSGELEVFLTAGENWAHNTKPLLSGRIRDLR